MHCEHHSSSPSGHPEGWPPKPRQETFRAGCSLPGLRWCRLGRWDAFDTHRPVNPHCVPPAAFRQTPILAVWRWCEHGYFVAPVHTSLMTMSTKMPLSRARSMPTRMTLTRPTPRSPQAHIMQSEERLHEEELELDDEEHFIQLVREHRIQHWVPWCAALPLAAKDVRRLSVPVSLRVCSTIMGITSTFAVCEGLQGLDDEA